MIANQKWSLVGLALLSFVYLSVFTVHETEKAIKFKLGEIVKSDYESGMHFKIPFINDVKYFSGKILTLDSNPERFLTSEKKNVIVDSYVKWRVTNVARYYTTVEGDRVQANMRLDQIIKNAMRGEFSKRTINGLIAEDQYGMRDILIKKTVKYANELGIKVVDIRIKRIDLPDEVSSSVYRRMEAERARVAREFRSQGYEIAERIKSKADKMHSIILAEAHQKAEALRGEGDGKGAEIYAGGYNKDPEFFALYRSLGAYRKTFEGDGDVIVLNPNSEFFRYFGRQ